MAGGGNKITMAPFAYKKIPIETIEAFYRHLVGEGEEELL